ncbi:MAG: hypothetical protein CV087_21375 [Candidatus Brocadia sp. WS118]|nr:MAG: hypothetical protein CV087_21375 [Candidatus Brocadia sp. WS118]
MPQKIFISYARIDIDDVRPIYDFLRTMGYDPWMDIYNLLPGSEFKIEIQKIIEESDYCLACLSTRSVPKRGFIQKELRIALEVMDEFPEGEIFIIPARLDECEVPFSLKSKHWIDMFIPGAKIQLLKAFVGSEPDIDMVHSAMKQAELFSPKHNEGRIAFRAASYGEAERLAKEAYDNIPNPHSKLNEMVAVYAQGKIIKRDLDRWVYKLKLEDSGHGKSVLSKGF